MNLMLGPVLAELGALEEASFHTPELKPYGSIYSFAPHMKEDHSPVLLQAAGSFNCSVFSGKKSLANPSPTGFRRTALDSLGRMHHLALLKDPTGPTFGVIPLSENSHISLTVGTARSRVSPNTVSRSMMGPTKRSPNLQPAEFTARGLGGKEGSLFGSRQQLSSGNLERLVGDNKYVQIRTPDLVQTAVSRLGMIKKRESLTKLVQHKGDVGCPETGSKTNVGESSEVDNPRPKFRLKMSNLQRFKAEGKTPQPRIWGLTDSSLDTWASLAPVPRSKGAAQTFSRRVSHAPEDRRSVVKLLSLHATKALPHGNSSSTRVFRQTAAL